MKKALLICIPSSIFAIGMLACEQDTKQSPAKTYDTLQVKSASIKRSQADCVADDCARVELQWLEFPEEPKLNTAVQAELLTMLSGSNQQQTLGDFAQQFLNTAEPSWEAGTRVAIKRGSGRLITLELRSHQYTGGAHALPLVSYLNIDRDTGQVVNLNDLLKEDAQDRFWEAARQAHQRWLDSEPMGIRPIAEFTESDNVFIGPQTVELRYNVYTLGPYAIGQPSLEIPCEEVREYLQPAWATLCKPV